MLPLVVHGQALIINEVSNGPTGNQEYVEFVVANKTLAYDCAANTPPCIDIRGWIFDDNSGYHGTGGIAAEAMRFSNNGMWACVPIGTIIVIYNGMDRNVNMPPDDVSLTDGNCRIIAPASNTALFEGNIGTPGAVSCSYPATGWVACGDWTFTFLANSGDCARIVDLSSCWCLPAGDNRFFFQTRWTRVGMASMLGRLRNLGFMCISSVSQVPISTASIAIADRCICCANRLRPAKPLVSLLERRCVPPPCCRPRSHTPPSGCPTL